MWIVQLDASQTHVVGVPPSGEYVELEHEAGGRAHVQVGSVHQAVHAKTVRLLRVVQPVSESSGVRGL